MFNCRSWQWRLIEGNTEFMRSLSAVCLPRGGSVPKNIHMSGSTASENRQRILYTPQNCFHLTSTDLANLLLMQVEFAGFLDPAKQLFVHNFALMENRFLTV